MNCFHASIHAHTHQHVHRAMYNLMFFFYDKLVVHMCIYTFTVACMYSLHACSCIHSMYSVHASANISASSTTTDQCSMSCFHASIHDKLLVHMCMCTFSIACMYSLRTCSCIHSTVPTSVRRLWQPIDWCSINFFHVSIHAHTHHHVYRALYTLLFFVYDKLVVPMCIYTFTVACMYAVHAWSCIHSMFSVHASVNISASSTTTDQCSMSCFHASVHAHTHHHVHRTLYTLMFFFYDKLVVHNVMCMYTFTIACMYSLLACSMCIYTTVACMYAVHAWSCIHSMFSVHASVNISASSTTTDQCSMSCFHASVHAHTIIMCTEHCTL